MDAMDPWTVTVAVTTVCVGIILLQWFTFQKKLKASNLLMEQLAAQSPKVAPYSAAPSPIVQGSTAPSPVVQGSTAPSLVAHGSAASSPVVDGSVAPSPVVHGSAAPSPVVHGSAAPSPVVHGSAAPSPVAHVSAVPSPVVHVSTTPSPVAHGSVAPSPVAHGSAAPSPVVPTPSSAATVPKVSEPKAPASKARVPKALAPKEREDSNEPPPVKLPPLPEFFDQTFTEYGAQYGTPVVDRHRTTHPECRFVRRIIRNCLPKDMVSPKSMGPFTDRFLFAYESTRIYYLHLPKGVSFNAPDQDFTEYCAPTSKNNKGSDNDNGHQYPVVIFIHDMDETCFDGEFIDHPKKRPSQTWLDLSDEEGIILVFAQARGQWAHHKSARREAGDLLKTLWLLQCEDSNQLDQVYLEKILDDLREICSQVDMKKIYLTGYVKGGFLATDVAIGCTVKSVVDSPYIPWLKYPLAAVCLYMGGITNYQMSKTLNIDKFTLPSAMDIMPKCSIGITKKDNEENKSHKPDVLIVTGEPEIFSCVHAMQCFYHLGYGVRVIRMDDKVQAYYPDNTMEIWKFFQHSPHL